MNKKLLVVAIGAIAALPFSAQAAGPTLYGKLNLSLENKDNGTTDTWTVESNASRLGIKGDAETGIDGVTGIYVAEFEVKADDGVGPFKARNIYTGIKGGFGTVLMGNVDTPTKTVQGKVDQFNDTSADMKALVAGDLRAPNVLAYATPKLGDAVTVTAALWQSEAAGDGIGEATSVSAVYDNGGIYVGVGMDMEVPVTGGVNPAGGAVVTAGLLNDITRVVAGYNADSIEVGFMYQMAEDTAATPNESTSMLIGGAFKSGDLKVKAQYVTTDAEAGAASNTETLMAFGADYALGKATTVYGWFAMNEDDFALEDQFLSLGIEQKF